MQYQRTSTLLEADLGDEMVGLDEQAGFGYGFNATATRVWKLLEIPRSIDDIVNLFLEEYDVDRQRCAAEVEAVIDDMVANGLVTRIGG